MTEAKAMAAEQSEAAKKIVNENIAVVMDKLDLPEHWFKADTVQPEKLFEQLDDIIQQCSNVVETGETYQSEVEVIKKASAGRALCGIYHSEYEAPKPAAVPLLQVPENVTLTSPNSAQEINFMKFSKKGAAADYVRTVESSSTNIGFGVAGFYGLYVGEVKGAHGSERQTQADHSIKTSTTSASVLQSIRRATKSFQLDRDKITLSRAAMRMALSIFQDDKARLFLERYGSHLPAGVQTLGGIFFSIVDAESKRASETSKLTEAAVAHLRSQTSLGFLGGAIGGSLTVDHSSAEGRNVGSHRESESDSFTYSVKSMGPPATNPITFQKLLSYNSTWALIDRGPFQGYIPVWELLRDLGGTECEAAARVIEETWRKDEKKRKEDFEAKTWCGTRREESGRSNTDIPDGRQGARPKVHHAYGRTRRKHDLVILDCNTADESIRAVRQMMEDLRPELNLSTDPPVVRGSAVELKSYLMMNSVRFCWLVVDAETIKDAYEHLPRRRTEYNQLLETASKEVVEKVLVTVCGPYSLPPRDEQSVSLAIKSILDKKDKGFMVWLKGGKVQMGTDVLLQIMSSIAVTGSSNLKASNPAGVEGASEVSSVPGSSQGDEQQGQGMVTSQSTNLPDVSNLPIFTTRRGERVRVLVKAHLRKGRIFCEEGDIWFPGWKVPEYIRTNLMEKYSERIKAELLLFLDNNGVLQCRVTPKV